MNKGYILGINGWFERSHDASACIVKNGKLLVMVEEERFTRKKHAYDKVPINSILWCLCKLNLTLDDIESVAIGWDYKRLYSLAKLKEKRLDKLSEVYFPKKYFKYHKTPSITLVPHHLAHAYSTYYLSGFDEASILIIDGQGEDASTTFAVGRQNQVKILWSLPVTCSLGYFYESVSDYIGLGLESAGKTMGLAPYGNPNKYLFPEFQLNKNGYTIDLDVISENKSLDQQQSIVRAWEQVFQKKLGVGKNKASLKFRREYCDVRKHITLKKEYKDLAASAQFTLEKVILQCVKVLVDKTKIGKICLGGGVALNCSTNTRLYEHSDIKDIFIPPFTGDSGVAVGAALYVGNIRDGARLNSAYMGPSFNNKEIESILKSLKIKYELFSNIEEETAKLIMNGYIVSWFQGAEEVGPRALGNRSIIANPTLPDIHRRVNEAKNREQWRPLAPSILDEKGTEYFEKYFYSPFMLHTFQVKKSVKSVVPAIVHVDGSTRPQSVQQKVNPRYYKLIKNFEKLTGIPIVLNTSFNGAKEPIISTPLDAISSFYTNSTDYLVLGNYLIKK